MSKTLLRFFRQQDTNYIIEVNSLFGIGKYIIRVHNINCQGQNKRFPKRNHRSGWPGHLFTSIRKCLPCQRSSSGSTAMRALISISRYPAEATELRIRDLAIIRRVFIHVIKPTRKECRNLEIANNILYHLSIWKSVA